MEATALIDRGAALPSSTGNLIDVVWFRFFCLDWLHICFIRHGVESLLVKRRRVSSALLCAALRLDSGLHFFRLCCPSRPPTGVRGC
jgi:hypothetical protein